MARIFDVIEYPSEMIDEIVHRFPETGIGDYRIGSQVIVRGTARRRRSDPPPKLNGVPALIVDAVSDHHDLSHSPNEMWFVLSKTANEVVST